MKSKLGGERFVQMQNNFDKFAQWNTNNWLGNIVQATCSDNLSSEFL